MISFLRRLLTRQPSELEQMRRNRDYWRNEALRLQEQALLAKECGTRGDGEYPAYLLGKPMCNARDRFLCCTRVERHDGEHIAHGNVGGEDRELHRWPR